MLGKSQAMVLSTANGAYRSGNSRLIEALPGGVRGDLLADYLANGLRRVSAEEMDDGLKLAAEFLDDAIFRLEVVRRELEARMLK